VWSPPWADTRGALSNKLSKAEKHTNSFIEGYGFLLAEM